MIIKRIAKSIVLSLAILLTFPLWSLSQLQSLLLRWSGGWRNTKRKFG